MQGPTVFQSGVLRRTSIHCSKVAGTLLDMNPRQGAFGNRFIRCVLLIIPIFFVGLTTGV